MRSIKPGTTRFIFPVFFLLFVLCWCLLVSSNTFADQSAATQNILLAIEKKYANNSFETQFDQTTTLEALDIKDKAFGKAFFSYPGKMHWEYKSPEPIQFITNGKTLWMFQAQLNQVRLGNADKFLQSGAGGTFLSDISMIRKNFDVRIKQETNEYVELALTSKKKDADINSIQIQVLKQNYEIIQVVTHSPFTDETTLIKFTNTKFKDIDPEVFEFKIPAGATVIKNGLN